MMKAWGWGATPDRAGPQRCQGGGSKRILPKRMPLIPEIENSNKKFWKVISPGALTPVARVELRIVSASCTSKAKDNRLWRDSLSPVTIPFTSAA